MKAKPNRAARVASTSAPRRFVDSGKAMGHYCGECFVECPVCHQCARLRERVRRGKEAPDPGWRVTCGACGYVTAWSIVVPWTNRPSLFGFPLWLRTTCKGQSVWALNEQHLRDLSAFVAATHRGRGRGLDGGKSSRSMVAVLPRWMISAKNRPEVLRALARLERKLATTG